MSALATGLRPLTDFLVGPDYYGEPCLLSIVLVRGCGPTARQGRCQIWPQAMLCLESPLMLCADARVQSWPLAGARSAMLVTAACEAPCPSSPRQAAPACIGACIQQAFPAL